MTFFWSDTHFGHESIIGYCMRPYRSVGDMNEGLIERWNSAVTKDSDTVWFLGDFGFRSSSHLREIFKRLRGRKNLIAGNHDDRNPDILKLPWQRVERLYTFKEGGQRAELCHYPLLSWKCKAHGALMIHGHSHGTLPVSHPRMIDVGCDVFPAPVSFVTLLKLAEERSEKAARDRAREEAVLAQARAATFAAAMRCEWSGEEEEGE